MSNGNGLTRIAVFYDGSFFWKVSGYYKHVHSRYSYIDISGLHEYIRQRVAELEANGNAALCQIVEAHFFRGRFSLKAVQATSNPDKQLEVDRYQDQILMHAGVVAHYHPMNESVSPPEEKGIDVWLALEAFDLAVHKPFDVLVLISGDSDFVPLVRKINSLGTRVLVLGVDFPNGAKTSQRLIDEASYTIMLSEEVDSKAAKSDPIINGMFR
ncbi:MAG: NYN domain-containing protein [Betaproteobacteria bacterium]|nr:NYN domain-containing protein [Betaproteobacteria bacterium]MCL2887481.1 NYN domain-containing protein [Betaproteobacteria bacterium]